MVRLTLFIGIFCSLLSCIAVKSDMLKNESDMFYRLEQEDDTKSEKHWQTITSEAGADSIFGPLTDITPDMILTARVIREQVSFSSTIRLSLENHGNKPRNLGLLRPLQYYHIVADIRMPDNTNIKLIHPGAGFVLNPLYNMYSFPPQRKFVVFIENVSDIVGSFQQKGDYRMTFGFWYYERILNELGKEEIIRVRIESDPILYHKK